LERVRGLSPSAERFTQLPFVYYIQEDDQNYWLIKQRVVNSHMKSLSILHRSL